MSEQLSFYKLFAGKGYTVEIPMIQRDYAQGRQSVSEVRDNFLDALQGYLNGNKPFNDLDFVYGDIQGNNFIPLDGQQRLTTLFLLHWYLALKDDKLEDFKKVLFPDGASKFIYKTRPSSTEFCNALLNNNLSLSKLLPADKNPSNSLSKTIKDSSWYFLSWDYDPTIQSMLCMLDAIHAKFRDSQDFYKKLIDRENPFITFQFLELKEYKLTEDLYIKMNSRGKPLTRFENFKAKFEQHIGQLKSNIGKYNLNLDGTSEKEVDAKTYFSFQIDTKWADLFWTFRDEKNVFDRQIMNFISTLAINNYALQDKTTDDIKMNIENQETLHLKFYLERNKEFIDTLIACFDLLSADPTYRKYLPECEEFHYYDEKSIFKKIINNDFGNALYPSERIEFFAYYSFLVYNKKNGGGLNDWMRVIVNFTENTIPYNNEGEFVNSVRAISKLLPQSNKILEYLRTNPKITGFNPSQVKEEIIKSHLINKKEWASEILKAEEHAYFKGQLTFALAFSGIEDYYDINTNCDWDNKSDTRYLNEFKKYVNLIFSLFNDLGLKDDAMKDHRFHRAVLSKGNYLLFAESNFSFLINSDRDISWKRLLLGDGGGKEKRKFVKEVIDDEKFKTDLASLDEILATWESATPDWQIRFIRQPELFNYLGSFKYIRYNNDNEIYLLKKKKMSGEHAELFTYSMYIELKRNLSFSPFSSLNYYFVSGETDKPCFYLDVWKSNGNNFAMNCYYENEGNFKIKFFDKENKLIDEESKKILKGNQFNEIDSNGANFELVIKENEVKTCIEKLCKEFSN